MNEHVVAVLVGAMVALVVAAFLVWAWPGVAFVYGGL